ncbi:hypothetical protein UPYG_G00114070 [Umbra pygmaea]|uniref:Ig-like domain-containing protein n=1 Tax=Umbra pygmaea TaxID=75934 RepID=A0ABD0X7H4_UMBPY
MHHPNTERELHDSIKDIDYSTGTVPTLSTRNIRQPSPASSPSSKYIGIRGVEKIMYILATAVCLLGFASAQTVTELTICLTKENNTQIDCKYQLNTTSPKFTCAYTQDGLVVSSTNASEKQAPIFKDRGNVTVIGQNICRLTLTEITSDKAKNYTCIIRQTKTSKMQISTASLAQCSAWSLQGSGLLLTMTSIFYLLEAKWL